MSTTSTAIYSNPLFATYSVYARNASILLIFLRINWSNFVHFIITKHSNEPRLQQITECMI